MPTHRQTLCCHWRKGRDSNSRTPCDVAGFQDRCLKPLGHPSNSLSVFIFRDVLARLRTSSKRRFLPVFYPFFADIAAFSAASYFATASSCIPGITCEYKSNVIPILECPRRSCTILG